ncbi:MAG: hypothetical protein HY363_03555 [Candidatus Aenigmarchaeota archaeon]|nr:hypothetical protein [Candidatus Aenigmarchaeota archaeon]
MKFTVVLLCVLVLMVGCAKQELPYKFVSDTKPVGAGSSASLQKTAGVSQPNSPVASKQQAIITWACKDSDYGDNTEAKGVVTGRNSDGTTFSYDDECFGNILVENNCANSTPESRKIRCERGCQNGFCI